MNFPTIVIIVCLQEFLFLSSIAITSSQRTNARQGVTRMSPTVTIPGQGTIIGKEILFARPQKVTAYLGIPYALPPVGPRRFAPPVTDPLESWEDQKNATKFAPSCLQAVGMIKYHEKLYRNLLPRNMEDPGVDEDCLYLNIFIPDAVEQSPKEGWPVMVWFHGGDFNTGTPAIWDATTFVNKKEILVVTVAYRLNIFGFFTTADAEAPGNYGMLDQVAALDWIQKNIELFGGSPSNVVIAGHNAGAISVGLHIVSPLSKGKFAKAMAMSGDPIETVRTPEMELTVLKEIASIFDHCNFKPTSAFIECLRSVPAHILLNRTAHIESWGPIVDLDTNNSSAPFLPKHPRFILEDEDFNAVPLMTGYTSHELSLAYIEENSNDDGTLTIDKFESKITDEILASINIPFDNTSNCEPKPNMVAEAVLFFYRPYPPSDDPMLLRNKYLALQTEKNYASSIIFFASKVSKKAKVFVYRFDYRSTTPYVVKDVPEWAGVPHMFELPFVWGLPNMLGSKMGWSVSDRNLADAMMTMIESFIRTGHPSLNSIKWDPFTEKLPGLLTINRTFSNSDVNAIDHRMLAFWNDYYPRLIVESLDNCCNSTSAAVTYLNINWKLSITSNVIVIAIINLFHV
ncbi:carboxylesterase 5A [Chelonus insularis]|uniref:carboxylesterase 5A n=1 Tax=Chelonus insularis TaxID=460826 RepID=UPI001588AB5D|nr:carboxylesterase 5A [Chelonus insularis]